jgi:arginyl-tRNA synthetase
VNLQLESILNTALMSVLSDDRARAEALATLSLSGKAEFGDYQLKCAMGLGKALGQKPQDVAAKIVAAIPPNDLIASAVVAGPGFVNITLHTSVITDKLQRHAGDERLGVEKVTNPKKFVIDYSGPNVAKPLHVGHLRSTIIGDALVRILRHLGHEVIGDNHLGDWGTQFGILLYGYKNHLDAVAYEHDPVRELARLYIDVRGRFVKQTEDDDEGTPTLDPVLNACREETAKLHAGDAENVKLWNQFMPACLEMLQPIYQRLDVKIDHALGESFYNPLLADVVQDLRVKGIAKESQGAVVIPNAKGIIPTADEMKSEEPPALIRKRDGAFTYTTTDLATIQYRVRTWAPDAMLYVVDARQSLHFRTLFANAKRWDTPTMEFAHIAFGSILGEDRKPFKSRDGNVIELGFLLDEAVRLGRETFEQNLNDRIANGYEVPAFSDSEKSNIAEVVGIGAVKYADLSGVRTSDYIFSFKKMLATDGNTATYMQYAYARCHGIFRKGGVSWEEFLQSPPKLMLAANAERALAWKLLQFEDAIHEAATKYEPHHITAYLWELAKGFSVFFESCPVLKAENDAEKQSRLLIVHLTGRTIQTALSLLGIRTVEQM